MALHPLRLRRALSRSYALLERSFHGCKARPISSVYAARLLPTPAATTQLIRRPFTSTTAVFRKAFNPDTDEIGPDTILFEGCDYNHWLITVDFPKDSNFTREQMIDTYVNIAAQVFGSVEEAKKKIYALSTTTYQGFQVECSEETSEKFKSIPQVVFVLPDSYIDPVNKEYGGDKYVNGDIFPRPPPIHYGRRINRDRQPREQNYSPPPQQNYGPPPHQNNRPLPQHNYGPPPQQSNSQSLQQNYGQPPPLPSQQNYGQPHQQNPGQPLRPTYVQPPSQNYGQPPQQKYGQSTYQKDASPQQQNYRPPQQQESYGPPPQQSYMPNTQGSYGNSPNFPPHPNYSPAGSGERSGYMRPSNTPERDERNSAPSYQGNFNRAELDYSAQGQGKFESYPRPGQSVSPQDANYGFSQDGALGQMSGGYRNFSSSQNN